MNKSATATDPLTLARRLIQARSVTPDDDGALDTLQTALESLGFVCRRLRFDAVDNLYARLGTAAPVFAFAGHTDVVPAGDAAAWRHDPFSGELADDQIWGRGAADMKGAIAAFIGALARHLSRHGPPPGSIALLITGDEEGPAVHGTRALMEALNGEGERFDHCLVGEPTNPEALGDQIKIGRRGSLNGVISAIGRQGHVAYPDKAINPIPALTGLLDRLSARTLDEGTDHFQASNLEITSIDAGNPAHNVIPAKATARFNIRFNTTHRGKELVEWVETETRKAGEDFEGAFALDLKVTGEAFLTEEGEFTALLSAAVKDVTRRAPALTTGGGTSDARFIKNYCPVAEFGLVGATMHQIDERAPVADIEALTEIYERILTRYFEVFAA